MLYRLSVSPHAGNYLLKGALLFSTWHDTPNRPTRDADLLGYVSDDVATIEAAFREICGIPVDDGLIFDPAAVKGGIREDAAYGGVRINLVGMLGKAKLPLQVDIGFGDAITPGPEEITYPVILNDQPAPKLRAYPKYTVVAEKFEAICKIGMANSRIKDYFDLWVLLRENQLDPSELQKAIIATFKSRKTPLPTEAPIGLTDTFAKDDGKQKLWAAFLKKNALSGDSLEAVVDLVRESMVKTGILTAGRQSSS
jgi:hypothetical protein